MNEQYTFKENALQYADSLTVAVAAGGGWDLYYYFVGDFCPCAFVDIP